MSDTKDTAAHDLIIASLAPLKAEARANGTFLYCAYQDLWFSPDELDAHNAQGSFVWGPVNWQLRDPAERTARLEQTIQNAQDALDQWKARIARW